MWLNWLPWRYLVRRAARAHGFLDPIAVLSRLYRFAQPSEVATPIELLRAGVIFHARGLMNTGAIQHNLDWIWPYWIERQFDPLDDAFIPRAFSITHVNLTHRNWTAVGVPNVDLYPIVDPRGLLTPHWDGWSLDGWVVAEDGTHLFPSKCPSVEQRLELGGGLAVVTEARRGGLALAARTEAAIEDGLPVCRQTWIAASDRPAWFVAALRPCNPEGVSFVHRIEFDDGLSEWIIDRHDRVVFSRPAERHRVSNYRRGDVFTEVPAGDDALSVECDVGMATAAAMFELTPGKPRTIEAAIPLTYSAPPHRHLHRGGATGRGRRPGTAHAWRTGPVSWPEALAGHAAIEIPDAKFRFLYEAALRTLVLHSPGEVYPGPYTYKRFWVRDTAFILQALLCAGLTKRAEAVLPHLLSRQTHTGYFLSQEGEWDANGEALWSLAQFCRLTGTPPPDAWRHHLLKGAGWILHKRLARDGAIHAGLLPPGFSAEHLGPSDYYYWDDFWSVAGLRAAAELLETWGESAIVESFRREADDLLSAVERSLAMTAPGRSRRGIPASPYRRMDAGAVGSLAAGYPLKLLEPGDSRLLDTVAFLREHCTVAGGFFQDMIHSGINPYLTLHLAQVLLRAGDPAWFDLLQSVADLASPTGQWPEAIHPRTRGGCMGDGQHVWAAAEWVMALRNAFVREEEGRLVLASGIPAAWLATGNTLAFGPAPTYWGEIDVTIQSRAGRVAVRWRAAWRDRPPVVEVRVVGFKPRTVAPDAGLVELGE
ncbi:MAG: glycoside hydrolase family 15 protein [Pirellulales bacterium]